MPSYTTEDTRYVNEVPERRGVAGKPGLAGDLEMLDKQLGMLSQAVTALTKTLEPVLGPERPTPEVGEASGPQDGAERDVVHMAPLRDRVSELADGVAKVRKRVEGLSERVEL